MMSRKSTALGFAAGLVAGLAGSFVWLVDRNLPRASAQGVRVESVDFQIATWVLPNPAPAHNDRPARPPSFGAYLIDTKRGNVYLITGGDTPKFIGSTAPD